MAKQILKTRQNFKIAREPNLVLANREAAIRPPSGSDSALQIQWAAVAAAHEMAFKKSNSFVLEYIYNKARTHFTENS
jgi:hypothetical protein